MLAHGFKTGLPSIGDERGFSLIELLVATAGGLVICLALFSLLSVSTREETRLTDVTQSDQLGRIAMTKIIDELHSACLAPGFAPVLYGSGESELVFINAYSEEAVIAKANKHRIVWNEKAGTLTDYTYPSNGGNWPTFTFAEAPSSNVILAYNIAHAKSGETTLPIFRYYNYSPESSSSSTSALGNLSTEPLPVTKEGKLEEKAAPTVASVLVSFDAGPNEKKTEQLSKEEEAHRTIELSDQVTLSFSVPKSETPLIDSPCQ
jgi:hypothetical protein